jgi:hypothetical protein
MTKGKIQSDLYIKGTEMNTLLYDFLFNLRKFVSDLQQGGGFLWELWFPPPIKLTATI